MSGLGGLFGSSAGGVSGAAGIAAMFGGSSRDFKDGIESLTADEYATILDEVESTPVYRWNYKPEFGDSRRHIGPVVEESPAQITEGKMLVPIDYMGFMFGAIKALNEKVKRLENARSI